MGEILPYILFMTANLSNWDNFLFINTPPLMGGYKLGAYVPDPRRSLVESFDIN
jgi:hypothetical protein